MDSCSKAKKLTFMTLVTRALVTQVMILVFVLLVVFIDPNENPILCMCLVYRITLVTVDEVAGWILGGFLSPISRR